MIPEKNNIKIIFATLLIFQLNLSKAQSNVNVFCNGKEYSIVRFYQGDSIKIDCDTAYMINTATFKLYDQVFKNHRTVNSDIKRLTVLYDYTKTLYENRIAEQDQEYQKLKIEFDSLVKHSTDLAKTTSSQLSQVNTSLSRIDSSIEKANENVEEAKKLIRAEMKNSYKQKLKWGLGGFAVGIMATALLVTMLD